MANKNKIINQAQKYIAKGQWDKAVKELQKAIALDPSDVRTLLKLGDVYSKKGDRENATTTYKEVADSYSEQGFFLKAVAVHKQILKHDGLNLDVRLKLAELYEQLGLATEAQVQYQEVARIHDEKGDTQGSLEVLQRLVELDSENVASRIKLAEGFSRAGRVEDAVQAFAKAAAVLKRQNRLDDYVKVAERLVFHDPARVSVIKDLARLYLSRGDTKRGLAKLQLCFKAEPRDIETLTLLAQAFTELGQTQKTLFVYKELAGVYTEADRLDDAEQAHRHVLELDPSDHDARQALGLASVDLPVRSAPQAPLIPVTPGHPPRIASDLADPGSLPLAPRLEPRSASHTSNSVPRSNADLPLAPRLEPRSGSQVAGPHGTSPDHEPAPRPPSLVPRSAPPASQLRPPPPRGVADIPIEDPVAASDFNLDPVPPPTPPPTDTARGIQDIITETDVFVRYGLTDKALEHLRRVFALDANNVLAFEKMRDIYMSMGDQARAAEAAANLMHVHARSGDTEAMEAARDQLAQLAPGHPLAQGGLPGALPPRMPAPPMHEEDDLSIDIIEDSGVFALDDFADSTAAEAEASFAPPEDLAPPDVTDAAPRPDPSSPFIPSPSFGVTNPSESTADLLDDMPTGMSTESGPVFDDDEATMAVPGLFDRSGGDRSKRVLLPLGDTDPFAENVVTEFPNVGPGGPLSALDDDGFGPADDEVADEGVSTESGDASEIAGVKPVEESESATEEINVDDEIQEAMFYIENGLVDEARDTLSLVLDRVPNNDRARQLIHTLDLSVVEGIEGSTEELDGLPEILPPAAPAVPDISDDDLQDAFGSLGEPSEDSETSENHYDLGMVMMETMRFDEALIAFEKASHAPERALSALEMMGNCHRQMGQPLEGIEFYARAIERGAEGSAAVNLKYEIGAAYEEAGELKLAYDWMEKCAASDPGHRDVSDRIASLVTQVGMPKSSRTNRPLSDGSKPKSGKKSKISYL